MIRRTAASMCMASIMGLGFLGACGDDAQQKPPKPSRGGSSGSGGESGTPGGAAEGGAPGGDGGSGGCVPRTCAGSGVLCGTLDDGCGSVVDCNEGCGSGGDAGGGGCEPTTCARENKNCGRISNGCGAELECGTCEADDCGVVVPNVCGCPPADQVFESVPRTARSAASAGFEGTDEQYLELYEIPCETVDDCSAACLDRGGIDEMCDASECSPNSSGASDCLPAPVWSNLQGIEAESTDVSGAVQLVAVFTPYRDRLLTTEFGLEVPDAASIRGITVEVRRAGDSLVSDDTVRILKGGAVGEAERASSAAWTDELSWATYGGPTDLWGEEWTPADLVADDFGVALSVGYENTVGNARAYVDQVRVTVHYTLVCDE